MIRVSERGVFKTGDLGVPSGSLLRVSERGVFKTGDLGVPSGSLLLPSVRGVLRRDLKREGVPSPLAEPGVCGDAAST